MRSELFDLGKDIVLTLESLNEIVFPEAWASPTELDKFVSKVGKARSMLLNWKESLGSRASYRALARMLNTTIINAHDLVKTHCHDEGK